MPTWQTTLTPTTGAPWSSDTTTVRPLSRVFVAMGSFQASVSAAWAVDASSRPASNSITCRVRTEFSLFPDVDRHGSATGRPPDGPEVMPAPRVWPRDHRSPQLSRPPSPAAQDQIGKATGRGRRGQYVWNSVV